jgi:histidine triad (HIT) family protein
VSTADPYDPDCIFCRIIRREAPAVIRYESDGFIAFDDYRPHAPTHVLVCPKAHYPTFVSTPPEILTGLNAEIKMVAEHLNVIESGFRMIVNNGSGSGQIVFHLHYHLLAGRRLPGF